MRMCGASLLGVRSAARSDVGRARKRTQFVECFVVLAAVLIWVNAAHAKGCNIADVLFGKVRVEILPHKEPNGVISYETVIIFGNDYPEAGRSKFDYMRILGQIESPERDGTRHILDVTGELCGNIEVMDKRGRPLRELIINTSDVDCASCDKTPIVLRRVPPNSYVVTRHDEIMGTISGRLNK